mmetsp:Transcript_7221/g.20140  ORF Transcript_7221/g.20140 Transcript_7221/m.20140 type:complete len:118 (-) Transcript_7221:456-809(-)
MLPAHGTKHVIATATLANHGLAVRAAAPSVVVAHAVTGQVFQSVGCFKINSIDSLGNKCRGAVGAAKRESCHYSCSLFVQRGGSRIRGSVVFGLRAFDLPWPVWSVADDEPVLPRIQ